MNDSFATIPADDLGLKGRHGSPSARVGYRPGNRAKWQMDEATEPNEATEPTEPTETQLLARVAQGDQDAFGQFYDRMSGLLFSFAMRILRNETAAEDELQEVFLQIWERASTYNAELGKPLT